LEPVDEMKQVFTDNGNYFYEGNVQKVSQERNKNEGIGTFPLVHIISYSCNCVSTINKHTYVCNTVPNSYTLSEKKLYLLQGNNRLSIIVSSFSIFIITHYICLLNNKQKMLAEWILLSKSY